MVKDGRKLEPSEEKRELHRVGVAAIEGVDEIGVANNREKGPGDWKMTLQKPKRFDYKASLGGCTWERNGIKFIKNYILSFLSSGPLCTWLQ